MEIHIREENKQDYDMVYEVVKSAFECMEHADGDEQDLVQRLRGSSAFVPRLSLVAEHKGEIVGHILFTEAEINGTTQLTLAPLSVVPSHQRQGIGGKLIAEGHGIAKELGYEFSVLVGHAQYYPRFGYIPASRFGIKASFEVPEENFMALNLQGKATVLNGTIKLAPEFGME